MALRVLPHQAEGIWMGDGGLETTLIFEHGLELPYFSALDLLRTTEGTELLRAYFLDYARLAKDLDRRFIIHTVTWRGSRDWASVIGWTPDECFSLNRRAVALAREICDAFDPETWLVNGVVGPRGDGYTVADRMSPEEAASYHTEQLRLFAEEGVDFVSILTMNYPEEAIGFVKAAQALGLTPVVSFTVETDGALPNGESLASAILRTDAATESGAAYFMINCAHPDHFAHLFQTPEPWMERIRGLQLNASCRSHAELDESTELDSGDPEALAASLLELMRLMPQVRVVGGCCGTDLRHLAAFGSALRGVR